MPSLVVSYIFYGKKHLAVWQGVFERDGFWEESNLILKSVVVLRYFPCTSASFGLVSHIFHDPCLPPVSHLTKKPFKQVTARKEMFFSEVCFDLSSPLQEGFVRVQSSAVEDAC